MAESVENNKLELLCQVLPIFAASTHCKTKSLSRFEQTCKALQSVVKDDVIWKSLYHSSDFCDYELAEEDIAKLGGYRPLVQLLHQYGTATYPPYTAPKLPPLPPQPSANVSDFRILWEIRYLQNGHWFHTKGSLLKDSNLSPLLVNGKMEVELETPIAVYAVPRPGREYKGEGRRKFSVRVGDDVRISVKLLRISDLKMTCIFDSGGCVDWESVRECGVHTFREGHNLPLQSSTPDAILARIPYHFFFNCSLKYGVTTERNVSILGFVLEARMRKRNDGYDGLRFNPNVECIFSSKNQENGVTLLHVLSNLRGSEREIEDTSVDSSDNESDTE